MGGSVKYRIILVICVYLYNNDDDRILIISIVPRLLLVSRKADWSEVRAGTGHWNIINISYKTSQNRTRDGMEWNTFIS